MYKNELFKLVSSLKHLPQKFYVQIELHVLQLILQVLRLD